MRIKIKFTKNTKKVPNNQAPVNSYIHKCLGVNNKYHDSASNYCVSGMLSGTAHDNNRYVNYPNGGFIIITSSDLEFINKVIMGVIQNTTFGFGMTFDSIDHIDEKFNNGWNYFKTTRNGFMLRDKIKIDGEVKYYTLQDKKELIDYTKNHIINKFSKINSKLKFNDLKIEIHEHKNHKTQHVYCNDVFNIANVCQINVHTNEKLAEALYNYGIGQSTGSGFGTIYTTKQHKSYV